MELLAVTSYFNPLRGRLRKRNYEVFRKYLGVKLITVEWSHESDFELCEHDADYLVQIAGGDLMWQKERLLNIGLSKARELGASNVALLDCDIVFTDLEWFRKVNAALENSAIANCYSHVDYLPRADYCGMSRECLADLPSELVRPSLFYGMLESNSLFGETSSGVARSVIPPLAGIPGLAIALRLDLYSGIQIYEGNIVGGGDTVLMAAATDKLDELFSRFSYSLAHQAHLRSWREKNFPGRCQPVYVNNRILHLWHGELAKRRYEERHLILSGNDFDPAADLEFEHAGALRFAPGCDDIKRAVAEYIGSREDS